MLTGLKAHILIIVFKDLLLYTLLLIYVISCHLGVWTNADDEGTAVASKEEAVGDGEHTVLSEPLCWSYGMCLTIKNVFLFSLLIYLKVSILHPRIRGRLVHWLSFLLEVNKDPLVWWKEHQYEYPLLSHLAKRYLCIPGISVSSERVFSTAGDNITAQRSAVLPEHVDRILFLNKNLRRM